MCLKMLHPMTRGTVARHLNLQMYEQFQPLKEYGPQLHVRSRVLTIVPEPRVVDFWWAGKMYLHGFQLHSKLQILAEVALAGAMWGAGAAGTLRAACRVNNPHNNPQVQHPQRLCDAQKPTNACCPTEISASVQPTRPKMSPA
jgi:hypothetical protein